MTLLDRPVVDVQAVPHTKFRNDAATLRPSLVGARAALARAAIGLGALTPDDII